jgi:ABC-type transport system substrate-binding protein/predicted small lipoprotein YifL
MRKLFVVLSLLIAMSMALAACGGTAPEAPAAEPAAPAAEEPAAPPAAEEPTEEVSLNPYIGSNMLDGNGIPGDFFTDVHIRKAFSYCFDWQTFIDDVYKGEAVQSIVLSLEGMPGFDANAPHYTYDPDKCAEEFQLASNDPNSPAAGVWDTGFRFQMLYNQGNSTRQIVAEILAQNLSAVNDKFVVETLGLPWPAYLTAQRAHRIPIMPAGWLEDIHDAHNWYQPYTTGSYGSRQAMPEDLKAQFKALLDEGVSLTDPAARNEVYQRFNQLYYDEVPGVPLVLATSHSFQQKWLQGRVLNPLYCGYIYAPMTNADGKNPGTITNATIGGPDTLDPALSYDTASCEVIQNVYETLVFYDGAATDKFVPMLAESWEVSDDGTVWTFKIREGVKFHEGGDLTPSDLAYSFQRGLLQGGYASPQWLLAEPFYGVGNDDISAIVDEWASADDRESMMANDPATLVAACEKTKAAIVADDAAGTVTFTLAQAWGPFLPTIANAWGSVMDQQWVVENGGWDGSCDTWQNYYAMTSAENPFTPIANGTGAFKLDHWTPGEEVVLTRNDGYWGEAAKPERVVIAGIDEWGTRFAMLQAGDADIAYVPVENRPQADAMVGEFQAYDAETGAYGPTQQLCKYDPAKLGLEQFVACGEGETGLGGPLHMFIGRPGLSQDIILYNFGIE